MKTIEKSGEPFKARENWGIQAKQQDEKHLLLIDIKPKLEAAKEENPFSRSEKIRMSKRLKDIIGHIKK